MAESTHTLDKPNPEALLQRVQTLKATYSFGMKSPITLYLIRGLPGSGKTTLAKNMIELGATIWEEVQRITGENKPMEPINHFEADQFWPRFTLPFNGDLLGAAHGWCLSETMKSLMGPFVTIVSNTFTTWREMTPYIALANALEMNVSVIRCTGEWKSTHNVPDYIMEAMKKRFENIPGEVIVPPGQSAEFLESKPLVSSKVAHSIKRDVLWEIGQAKFGASPIFSDLFNRVKKAMQDKDGN